MARLKFKEGNDEGEEGGGGGGGGGDQGGQGGTEGSNKDKDSIKLALGMYSKDGEYVDFETPCNCVGQVEVWLNHLLETMQATIRHEFMEAVVSYEEKPRDQWIFEPPAQVLVYSVACNVQC